MGSRDLFDKGKPYKVLANTSIQQVTEKVESARNVQAQRTERERFVPQIDYSDPSNFVRFGSAEKYYEDAFNRILSDYPYDGSQAEITEFFNSSSYLDLYILEKEYPRTTGYAILLPDGGSGTKHSSGWGKASTPEYISFKGGPHTASGGMPSGSMGVTFTGSNYYNTDIYDTFRELPDGRVGTRESNLKFDWRDGQTIEFWLKKDTYPTSLTDKEIVFDLWNGVTDTGSADYGRLIIYLTASADGLNPFRLQFSSGSISYDNVNLTTGQTTSSLADNQWHHYAFSFKNTDGQSEGNVYLDGKHASILGPLPLDFGEVTGSLQARIGALQTNPSGNTFTGLNLAEYGQLSASIDEFRYWKSERTPEEIGLHYFTQVGGGTNTDISNTELGVYYKFNEGITGTSSIDSIVLDYSGRITNGTWTGYPGSSARNTGSAIASSSLGYAEFEDPIIRIDNSLVINARDALVESGSSFDTTNNSTLYNRFPSWIQDEDPGTLKQITQVMTSYLDSLHLQMEELPGLKDADYVSGSNKPLPIANKLVANYGMQAPEIFADAEILSQVSSRDELRNFELELGGIKDRIYKNIYNNLVYIYKSKGTLKSFRNLIRCYGVDENVVQLNLYGNNVTTEIRDNYNPAVVRKKYVDFNYPDSWSGVVTQQSQSSNLNSSNVTFVSGTVNEFLATTAEVEVIFPKKTTDRASITYYDTSFYSASIAGTHILSSQGDPDCYVQAAIDSDNGWGLYAVRLDLQSPDAYFVFKSHTEHGGTPDFYLTSSVYPNLYNNEKWNFAIRTRSAKFPTADMPSGSNKGSDVDFGVSDTYTILELYGVNYEAGILKNEIFLTSSAIASASYLTSDRRYYMGAARTNWTGSLNERTDIKATSLRHWESFLEKEAIKAHARDPYNFGSLRPYRSTYLLQTALTGTIVPELATLTFNWDYDNVTGSDSSGEFVVLDKSSGSIETFGRYHDNENNPQFSRTVAFQYPGRAYGMRTSTTGVIDRAYLSAERQAFPESLGFQDTVNILTIQDETEFTRDSRPINYYFSFEKSMYSTISQEMLNFFGSIVEFNELIGDPKNRYRQEYKELGKLRELFFEKVGNTPDLDKYVDYYKWIDASLSVMLQNLVPATADFSDGIRTMIESHVLERSKYWSKFPTLEFKVTDPEAAVRGITELKYDWEHGHAPLTDQESDNCLWWKDRAERTSPTLSSSVASVNVGRDNIREVSETYRTASAGPTFARSTRQLPTTTYEGSTYAIRRFDEIYNFLGNPNMVIHGGPNFSQRKRFDFVRPALAAFEQNKQILNVITNVELEKDCDDTVIPEELNKQKLNYTFEIGNADIALGLKDNPYTLEGVGDVYTPFSAYSSSVTTGYVTAPIVSAGTNLQDVFSGSIENYHHDVVGNDMEVPLQSPFTEKFVGGNQWRHQDLVFDPTLTSSANRGEGWSLATTSKNELQISVPSGPYSIYTRGEGTKRTINIENIQRSSSDSGHVESGYVSGTLRSNNGNFDKFYDIVQTSGRSINNRYFVDNEGVSTSGTVSDTFPAIVDYTKPDRGRSEHIFVQRFAAPGGPEVAGDSNGGYGLDSDSAEFSPSNALPFRNTTVRSVLNRNLLTNHTRQFGFYSGSAVSADDYSGTGSYHKTNRNPLRSPALDGALGYGSGFGYATVVTGVVYDNYFITHEIPRMETSYAWISASYTSSNAYGHGNPDGIFSNSAGLGSDINFVSASDNGSNIYAAGRRAMIDFFTDPKTSFVPTTTHLNTNIVEPHTSSTATVGYETSTHVTYYANYGNIDTEPDTALIEGSFVQRMFNDNFTTASMLHEVLIHRNGYYGHPSWKQIRGGESQLVRNYRNNNQITINPTPGAKRFSATSPTTLLKDRFGALKIFDEPSVDTSKKALRYNLGIEVGSGEKAVAIEVSYGNMLNRFANRELSDLTTNQIALNNLYTPYDTVKKTYLNGGLESPTTPVTSFYSLKYRESVFPASYNRSLEKVRERENFKVKFWDKTRELRTTLGFEKSSSMGAPYSGLFNQLTQSAWALDASQIFETGPICTASNASSSAAGELQNDYMQVHNGEKMFITASVLYSRKHMLYSTSSTISPLLDNPQTGSTTNTTSPTRRQGDVAIFGGNALWEADRLAGRIKTSIKNELDDYGNPIDTIVNVFEQDYREPIEPDYEKNMREAILQNQDYSVIPEFRISEHMDFYGITQNPLVENNRLFTIFGASGSLPSSSAEEGFYKVFSNSDFMKNFETIYEDHSDFRKPTRITLRCKAIKKFLPYDGFYPAQRTIDLATQFSKSFGRFMNVDGGIDGFASEASTYGKAGIRPLMNATFAPGILYNTIKSGLAVDYGVYTGSYEIVQNTGSGGGGGELFFVGRPISIDGAGRGTSGYAVGFDKRIPFEGIISPREHIANETFVDMEPHPSASMNLTCSWDGQGDPLYELMANNFFAESINMFLPNGQMSSFVSAKESEFRDFEIDKVYAMRIKLRKSFNQARIYDNSETANQRSNYPYPQVLPEEFDQGLRETFTMYSRPSAFGPPLSGRNFELVDIARAKGDPLRGYNPAYTPPYYDGEAWCDILFKAESTKHTVADIQQKAVINNFRIDNTRWSYAGNGSNNDPTMPYDRAAVNQYAMQITASINILGEAQVNSVDFDPETKRPLLVSDRIDGRESLWVIEPKFETPMFNFTSTSGSLRPITEADGNLTIPDNGKETVPRGMWHQFGLPPASPDEGIFMEVVDIPKQWAENRVKIGSSAFQDTYYRTELQAQGGEYGSLIDQIKFNRTSTRLGEVRDKLEVSEAIVAIPFVESGGVRKYFEISQDTIDRALIGDPVTGVPDKDPGDSVKNQIDLMRKYVIPPPFNFLDFPDQITPIAMYIFEFKHTFDKDDLSYIWQNLPPKASTNIEFAEATISHPLLTNELMGKRGSVTNRAVQPELRWMVFKVKQKANINYNKKLLTRVGTDTEFAFDFTMGGVPESLTDVKYSYNWPYDFFSLVEFASIESEVSFENPPDVLSLDYLPEATAEQISSFGTRELGAVVRRRIDEVSTSLDEEI